MLSITEGITKRVFPLDNSIFKFAVPLIAGGYVARLLYNGEKPESIIPALATGFGTNLVARCGIEALNDALERGRKNAKSSK